MKGVFNLAEKSHSGNGRVMPRANKMEISGRQKEGDAPRRSHKSSSSAAPGMPAGASLRGPWGRARLLKVLRVLGRKLCQIRRQVGLRENRGRLANRNAGATVNAVYRIDVELRDLRKLGFILPRMNAIHRANLDAFLILGATIRDDESHESFLL
jgi:hypothetical protein